MDRFRSGPVPDHPGKGEKPLLFLRFPAAFPTSPEPQLPTTPSPKTVSSHLSNDIRIEGNLISNSDLIFDGSIKGNIESKGNLTIGKNADVEGDLKAEQAVIEGKMNGNGTFGHLRIAATAQISGSVTTEKLQMEEGASLSGECRVGKKAG